MNRITFRACCNSMGSEKFKSYFYQEVEVSSFQEEFNRGTCSRLQQAEGLVDIRFIFRLTEAL